MFEVTTDILAIVDKIAQAYKTSLITAGKVATGKLTNFTYEVEQDNRMFSIVFNLQDYWKYVENGRLAGKQPPIDAIAKWITVKPIIPRAVRNKVPSVKQLAFLIARSIGEHGTKPTKALKRTLESPYVQNLEDKLCDLLIDQIESKVEDTINKEIYN